MMQILSLRQAVSDVMSALVFNRMPVFVVHSLPPVQMHTYLPCPVSLVSVSESKEPKD